MKKTIVVVMLALVMVLGIAACETKTDCTVQFYTLCDAVVEPETVKRGEKVTRPADPYRENYRFDGWYASKDYNEEDKWSFIGYTVTSDMTLYAKWTALPTPGLSYKLINDSAYEVSAGHISWFGYKDIVIPSEYNGLPVTSIAGHAFEGYENITSISIPNSVLSIGERAFFDCSGLTSFVIPDRLKSIGAYAFSSCSGLKNILIPDSVTSIGSHAFVNCTGLTSIIIPDTVETIGDCAFAFCSSLTVYAEVNSQPEGWDSVWNLHNRPVVFGVWLLGDRTYVVRFLKTDDRIVNPKEYTISAPYREGYEFYGWTGLRDSDVPEYTAENIETATEGGYFAIWLSTELFVMNCTG